MSDKPHRNLVAWQVGMELVLTVYKFTKAFPKDEVYGLTSEIRRAAVSVPSNIAEGAAGRTTDQFSYFLSNAIGSLNELDTQLDLAFRLGYLEERAYNSLQETLDRCTALTYNLKKSVRSKVAKVVP